MPAGRKSNGNKPSDQWIQTYSRGQFFPLKPKAADVKIVDIAAALSKICRFTGHVSRFYSVAEHSVRVSFVSETVLRRHFLSQGVANPPAATLNEIARWGLIHDASEAYLADIAAPVKRSAAFVNYRLAEDRLQAEVAKACGLKPIMPTEVKTADLIMLATEAIQLLPGGPREDWILPVEPDQDQLKDSFGWDPGYAERRFLDRFAQLANIAQINAGAR